MIGKSRGARRTSAQVQVDDDPFRPLPEYCLDPLEITAVGLKIGQEKMEKAQYLAKKRGIGEFAIIGDCGIYVMLYPPEDARPPEGWLHEFVQPKWLALAKKYVTEEDGSFNQATRGDGRLKH